MTWIYFMRENYEVFSIFKIFISLVKKQNGLIKVFKSDIGKEFNSNEFDYFCEDEGIGRQL